MLVENVVIDEILEKRDRNWMIRIYSSLEQSPDIQIECHREVVLVKDGKRFDTSGEHGERKYMIVKKMSEIANDTVTIPDGQGGTVTLTAAQVAMALEQLSDQYAES